MTVPAEACYILSRRAGVSEFSDLYLTACSAVGRVSGVPANVRVTQRNIRYTNVQQVTGVRGK